MGNFIARPTHASKRVIWCDTEGGVRGTRAWDVTFIDEALHEPVKAIRFFSVADAHKGGKAKLRKFIPMSVYASAAKTGAVYVSEHELLECGRFGEGTYKAVGQSMQAAVAGYLTQRKGCVLCAWNMRAHDKRVLTGLAGKDVMDGMVLWDALPWFKSNYTLPKNTLSSTKPGTPRGVFRVQLQGLAHTSLADAAHLREVVMRAAYCLPTKDVKASSGLRTCDMFEATQKEIEKEVDLDAWVAVPSCAWQDDIPKSVYNDT